MKEVILDLFSSLYELRIDKAQFFDKFYEKTGFIIDEVFCIKQLELALIKEDVELIDLLIRIIFMIEVTSQSSPIMCKLLKSPLHYKHEEIAMLLKKLKDPSTVDFLFEAAELQFDYLDYDDTYQFSRKCIKALSAIGDSNAITKLKLLCNSKITEISNYAKKELAYKDIL